MSSGKDREFRDGDRGWGGISLHHGMKKDQGMAHEEAGELLDQGTLRLTFKSVAQGEQIALPQMSGLIYSVGGLNRIINAENLESALSA